MNKINLKRIKRIARRKINFIGAPVYRYVSSSFNRMRIAYTHHYENSPIVPRTILFESRDGQSFTDSPYAMYKQMIRDARFADYTFYWVHKKEYDLEELKRNFTPEEVMHASFVERNSEEYGRLLATCEYVVTNSTFQSFYIKKDGQTYINTWHGTPLKTMGFDIPNNPFASQNVLRNFLMADYILSPNEHTSRIFIDSYKLKGLYHGQVVESGYPRIDLTLNTPREEVLLKLRLAGTEIDDNKPIVMYTPTWKGTAVGNPNVNVSQMVSEIALLREKCGEQYNILVKVHPFIYSKVRTIKELQGCLVPDYYDANEMMAAVDLLITDYSSIFFDYLVTNRPIIFYAWDKDLYDDERGMYIEEDELPGPVISTIFEVIDTLKHIDEVQPLYQERYNKMKETMVRYDNGMATDRYLDYIFDHRCDEAKMTIYEPFENKHHIIMYPGGMFNNGITTSLINLLDNIDYNQYDVTLLCSTRKNKEVLNNLNKVNHHVRLMFKIGAGDYTVEEQYLDRLMQNRSVTPELKKYYPQKAYQREARRLAGCCHFESSIDFSGYSYFWGKYIVEMDANRKIVFQHNDLLADSQREVNGRHPHFINLRGIFSIYDKFDVLLSVSPITRDINLEHLKQYADPAKFQYCINTINPQKILATESSVVKNNEKSTIHTKISKSNRRIVEEGDYNLIPDLSQLNVMYTLHLSPKQPIDVLATTEIYGEKLVKVLIDSIYCGWMSEKFVVPVLDDIVESVPVEQYAQIVKTKNHAIYSAPYNTTEDSVRHSALGYLKNVIVYVDRKVVTSRSTYVHATVGEEEIGWFDEAAIKYLKYMNEMLVYANHKKYQSQIESRPFFSESVQLIGRIITNLPELYRHEYGHLHNSIDDRLYSTNLMNRFVYVEYKMVTKEGASYKIRIPEVGSGWIREQDIKLYSLEEAPAVLYQQEVAMKVQMTPKTANTPIFEDLSDLVDHQLMAEEDLTPLKASHLHETMYAKTDLWTKVGRVVELVDEQQQRVGYGMQSQFETSEGLVDIHHCPVEIDHNKLNFVTMGRLSPEKNQAALIEAVAQLVSADADLAAQLRVYIIGSGPLQKELENLIKEQHLEDNVILLGQKENPFQILKECDCFVLSSVYEGQPMVLLEALTLGMNIIATNIPANTYVLEDGAYGLLTEGTTPEDIAATMRYYIEHRHELSFKPFDYKEYNQKAIQNFYDEI